MQGFINFHGRDISIYQLMAEVKIARSEYQRAKARGIKQDQDVAYGKLYELEHFCVAHGLNMG